MELQKKLYASKTNPTTPPHKKNNACYSTKVTKSVQKSEKLVNLLQNISTCRITSVTLIITTLFYQTTGKFL